MLGWVLGRSVYLGVFGWIWFFLSVDGGWNLFGNGSVFILLWKGIFLYGEI